MREVYLEDFGTLRSRQQVSTDSMALTQSPGDGAGKVAIPPPPKTSIPVSELPPPRNLPMAGIDIEPHNHQHHHRHHSVRHKHIHSGEVTETLSSNTMSQDIPIAAIVSETLPQGSPPKTDSISGTPPPEGRGRSRLVRRKVRSSSEESTCSSTVGEKDLALINRVTDLIGLYSQTGDYKELARIARDDGIPAPLRRIVWPILLDSHPFVKEKSLAKEYRHSSDTYTPRHIPKNRIRNELGRYHRRKTNTPNTQIGSPPSSTSPAQVSGATSSTLSTDPASLDRPLDQVSLDSAVEEAVISFLEKNDGVSYARGMVYVCFALADWIYVPPSQLAALNDEVSVRDPDKQAALLSKYFEQLMCIMLWAPPMQAPTGRMGGVTEQKISTFLTECRQLVPEVCVIMDDEEALGFEEEWVQSWVQWWCAKELGKNPLGRLWDWHLGYQKPQEKSDASGPEPDEGFEEAFAPSDWHMLVCVALLKCLHDHVDDLEQSEIRSLLSNIPDRKLGSMSKIIEVAKGFRKQLKEIREQEDEEYAACNGQSEPFTFNA
ncbi:hypothetical protein L211DRAFT_549031 [Terfezia boudieri ATCC MYA-4762]|uniref:Rab-GAP TBC domain-containing protein n=1 Tax=Terfezia boudieri ATCC MYA-4762 TaxID=1051890 RepID=A0A3N4LXG2_9PEZI|nr:hypothetical protein L211DRAFT_549031 [Terfezia boudieri ATCC MYA-4762]